MSEVLTIGSASATIYGTLTAATNYITFMSGEAAASWLAAVANDQKKSLASATRFIDQQGWVDDYDTFAERDALTAFQEACYELAVLILDDPDITAGTDQGSNIASLGAGSAQISFFNPTTGDADLALPPVLMRLIGQYLAAADDSLGLGVPGGASGGSSNPMSSCSDYDRDEPY